MHALKDKIESSVLLKEQCELVAAEAALLANADRDWGNLKIPEHLSQTSAGGDRSRYTLHK